MEYGFLVSLMRLEQDFACSFTSGKSVLSDEDAGVLLSTYSAMYVDRWVL